MLRFQFQPEQNQSKDVSDEPKGDPADKEHSGHHYDYCFVLYVHFFQRKKNNTKVFKRRTYLGEQIFFLLFLH